MGGVSGRKVESVNGGEGEQCGDGSDSMEIDGEGYRIGGDDGDGDGMDIHGGEGGGMGGDGEVGGGECDRDDGRSEGTGANGTAQAAGNGLPAFAEKPGVVPDMTGKKPVDYYRLFVTDSLLQNVLDETNRYGEQYVEAVLCHYITRSALGTVL